MSKFIPETSSNFKSEEVIFDIERHREILHNSWKTITWKGFGEETRSRKDFCPDPFYIDDERGLEIVKKVILTEPNEDIVYQGLLSLRRNDKNDMAQRIYRELIIEILNNQNTRPEVISRVLLEMCGNNNKEIIESSSLQKILKRLFGHKDPNVQLWAIINIRNYFGAERITAWPEFFEKILELSLDQACVPKNRSQCISALRNLLNNPRLEQDQRKELEMKLKNIYIPVISSATESREVLAEITYLLSDCLEYNEKIPESPATDFIRISKYDYRKAKRRIEYYSYPLRGPIAVMHCFALPRNFTYIFMEQYKDKEPVIITEEAADKKVYASDYYLVDLIVTGKQPEKVMGYQIVPFDSNSHRVECSFRMENVNRNPFGDSDYQKIPWFEPKYQILISDHEIRNFRIV